MKVKIYSAIVTQEAVDRGELVLTAEDGETITWKLASTTVGEFVVLRVTRSRES